MLDKTKSSVNNGTFDALERFLDYKSDLKTFFKDAFYSDLVNMSFTRIFAKLPDEPDINDFLDIGADCYEMNYRLNYRLNEFNHAFDHTLNWFVVSRIWENYPDNSVICGSLGIEKYPVEESEIKKCKGLFARMLRERIKVGSERKSPDSERLTDSVEYFLKKNFDMNILNISRISGTELVIKTEQAGRPTSSVKDFGLYLRMLIDEKESNLLRLSKALGASRRYLDDRLNNDENPTKNFLFRVAFGLELTEQECEELFKAAEIDLKNKTHSNDIKEKRRDEFLINLLKRGKESIESEGLSLGSISNICDAVNNILEKNKFEPLSTGRKNT